MRVLIADPHPLVHAAIRTQVEGLFPAEVTVGPQTSNGNEALRLLSDEAWDLFITEIMLSGRDGLQIISRMRRSKGAPPALVLSALDEETYGIAALRAGASGFVHKGTSLKTLRRAIQKVAAGRRYLSEGLAELLAETYEGHREEAAHEQLTGRERQVFLMLALGRRVGEIADELCVARKTIYAHRARVLKKIGAGSDADLRRYAFGYGLVPSRRVADMS